ncbi:MAG: RrF2 family transcriptional regulator [Phycisphaerales bacterium]
MLSQTVEYALRAMVHLAALKPEASLNSESIAEQTKVPQGYLSKILRDLVVAGLVVSQRGPNGGFTLARAPDRISMLDVISAVEPLRRITKCPLGNPAHLRLCPLHQRIDDALDHLERKFRSTSLADILASEPRAGGQCRSLTLTNVSSKKA